MPEDNSNADPYGPKESDEEILTMVKVPEVDLLGRVKYAYCSVAQISSNEQDVRIALGDRLPPDGRVEPLFGITLTRDHARRFLSALAQNLEKTDRYLARIRAGERPLVVPMALQDGKAFRITKDASGSPVLHVVLAGGGERILRGENFTDEVQAFIASNYPKALADGPNEGSTDT